MLKLHHDNCLFYLSYILNFAGILLHNINGGAVISIAKHLHPRKISQILRQDNRKVLPNQLRSKKRVRWVIRHNHDVHEVNCSISFYSGKKRVDHNGFKIMDVVDSKEFIDFMVFVGAQRVMFMVDDRTEFVEV